MEQTERQPLATTCAPRSKHSEQPSKSQLIREWVCKLALNAGQALDADAIGIYTALWSEGFENLPYLVLEAAFRKTLRECKYWPVKVSDIREHVSCAVGNAASEAAERVWLRVIDLRRVYWNPDIPGGFSRGMPQLSERIQQAARAAGVFRDHETVEALHVWAKKRFIESFVAWGEAEQDQFLLPDGETEALLAELAQTKALPAPQHNFADLHKRGLEYAGRVKAAAPLLAVNQAVAARWNIFRSEEGREEAYRALDEKEADAGLADKIRAQKAALEAKGFSYSQSASLEQH